MPGADERNGGMTLEKEWPAEAGVRRQSGIPAEWRLRMGRRIVPRHRLFGAADRAAIAHGRVAPDSHF
jgi:hypothetical protein